MPNYQRADIGGATYFFTVNTHRRQPFLIEADVRDALRAGIEGAGHVVAAPLLGTPDT